MFSMLRVGPSWCCGTLMVCAICGLLTLAPSVVPAEPFDPSCALPFDEIKQAGLRVDAECSMQGVGNSPAHLEQNRLKNNFCASGDPVTITFYSFERLQRAVESAGIRYGSSNNLPEDRAALKDMHTTHRGDTVGEGSRVRLVAFISHAKPSNTSKGESVNCKLTGAVNNDIHVTLVVQPDDPDCDSVTAEISPHFRPEAWTPANLNQIDRPVRITGHLFFDASHVPCQPGKSVKPERMSIWEIHPVYAIDVCDSSSVRTCKADDEERWEPLDEWLSAEDEEGGSE